MTVSLTITYLLKGIINLVALATIRVLTIIIIIIIDSCLMSSTVPIKVHVDYCRDIDTKNLQGEHEW